MSINMGMGMGVNAGQQVNLPFQITIVGTGDFSGYGTLSINCPNNSRLYSSGNTTICLTSGGTYAQELTSPSNSSTVAFNIFVKNSSAVADYLYLPFNMTKWNGWTASTNQPSLTFVLNNLPTSLTYFSCTGANTISGTLPSTWGSMTRFDCTGSNKISGTLPTSWGSMTYFVCASDKTISGTLPSTWGSMTYFYCTGVNTISGTLPTSWGSMTSFYCASYNTINDSSLSPTSSATWDRFYFDPTTGGGLDQAEQSALLVMFATRPWSGYKTIGFYAPNTSMANTDAAGIWNFATPTDLALAVKHLVITHGVVITLQGITWATDTGLPTGFYAWLTS
jgi:hypothetical protein